MKVFFTMISGLTNTVTAVKNAQMAESPVLLLGGAAATLLQVCDCYKTEGFSVYIVVFVVALYQAYKSYLFFKPKFCMGDYSTRRN